MTKTLLEPDTRFSRFFPALGRAAEIVAPVAEQNADAFTKAGITFAAISSDPQALKETISETSPTLETGDRHAARASGRSCATSRSSPTTCVRASPTCG